MRERAAEIRLVSPRNGKKTRDLANPASAVRLRFLHEKEREQARKRSNMMIEKKIISAISVTFLI
jgi:hypothetical protein